MSLSNNKKLVLQQFFAGKPVKKAWLFGSYARNDEGKESDIDILLELDHTIPIGMKFFGYHTELEELLKNESRPGNQRRSVKICKALCR